MNVQDRLEQISSILDETDDILLIALINEIQKHLIRLEKPNFRYVADAKNGVRTMLDNYQLSELLENNKRFQKLVRILKSDCNNCKHSEIENYSNLRYGEFSIHRPNYDRAGCNACIKKMDFIGDLHQEYVLRAEKIANDIVNDEKYAHLLEMKGMISKIQKKLKQLKHK